MSRRLTSLQTSADDENLALIGHLTEVSTACTSLCGCTHVVLKSAGRSNLQSPCCSRSNQHYVLSQNAYGVQLNVRLEADVSRLSYQLAAAHSEDGSSIAELVNDMSANSTRLSNEKQMVRAVDFLT